MEPGGDRRSSNSGQIDDHGDEGIDVNVNSEDVTGRRSGQENNATQDGTKHGGAEGGDMESGDGSSEKGVTFEIDLNEVRWAEHTGGERRLSDAAANKLAGE